MRVDDTARGRRAVLYLLYAAPMLTAFALYGYTLTLPFFLDDAAHFDILATAAPLAYWGDFPAFPYYRPIAFTIWDASSWLIGDSPLPLHALNLFSFGLCGVLTGQVARRMMPSSGRRLAAVGAGLIFVLFPFSYQAVAMIAALFHLTLTLGTLFCLWLALRWLDGHGGVFALAGCWVAAFVATFSHETGALLVPLLAGLIAVVYRHRLPEWRRLAQLMVPIGAISTVYLLLWLMFRPQSGSTLTEAPDVAFAALTQGFIYPFAALLRPLIDGDASAGLLLALAVGIIVVVATLIYWRGRRVGLAVAFGLGWYAVAIIPAALFLSASYVLGQPRLALFASVGAGVFWGVALAALYHVRGRAWWVTRPAVIVFVLLAAYIAIDFLSLRRADLLHLRDYQRELLDQFEQFDVASTGALLVNAPDYVTPDEADRRFLLGTEGVLFVDPAAEYGAQLASNARGRYRDVTAIALPAIQRSTGFGYSAHPPVLDADGVIERVRDARQVFVTIFDGRAFMPLRVGGTALMVPDLPVPLSAFPESDYALLNAGALIDDAETVTVWTQWQAGETMPVKLFVHVTCDGALVGQSDGYPWGDTYPFAAWEPGETQVDIRQIRLDAPVTRACLRILTGLYTESDVTRLAAQNPETGTPIQDNAVVVPLTEVRPTVDTGTD